MGMVKKTDVQMRIELMVTNGLGYEKINSLGRPNQTDKEAVLDHLHSMDVVTGVLDVQYGGADRPHRNAPCYCGSGRKYKRCHLLAAESKVDDFFYEDTQFQTTTDDFNPEESKRELIEASMHLPLEQRVEFLGRLAHACVTGEWPRDSLYSSDSSMFLDRMRPRLSQIGMNGFYELIHRDEDVEK